MDEVPAFPSVGFAISMIMEPWLVKHCVFTHDAYVRNGESVVIRFPGSGMCLGRLDLPT